MATAYIPNDLAVLASRRNRALELPENHIKDVREKQEHRLRLASEMLEPHLLDATMTTT